jgi:hypothetical protein
MTIFLSSPSGDVSVQNLDGDLVILNYVIEIDFTIMDHLNSSPSEKFLVIFAAKVNVLKIVGSTGLLLHLSPRLSAYSLRYGCCRFNDLA